ncbi:MAG: peroxiredoxin [Verrucomicrobia bacterium]|nr:peroxiredoxin [Verrucomicrobiota bacterium]
MKTSLVAISLPALKRALVCAAILAGLTLVSESAPAETKVKAGDPAPQVEGVDSEGKAWKLADLIGKKAVVLYFYPKDDTPGCTKQACGWRDRLENLKKDGVEIVGVSFDSPESHQKFVAKHHLNFTLVADTEGKIADAYGVRVAPGRNMARRVSFVIGLDGKVAHVTDTPSADTHLAECKESLGTLKK